MRCPICDGYDLGDGTEEADFNPCTCDDAPAVCSFCEYEFDDGETFWEAEGKTYCKECLAEQAPDAKRIGERH